MSLRLSQRWWPLLAAVLGLCGLWPAAALAEEAYAARVTRVFDGDTLWVQPLAGGRYRKLRLNDIDAPEICQQGGRAARDALAARVLRQVVWVQESSRDAYGRGLALVQHQGDDINRWLVRTGRAWAYRWRTGQGPYANDEVQASQTRRGLFADAQPEPPRDFRRRHGPCEWPVKAD